MDLNIDWSKLIRYFAGESPETESREIKKTLESDPLYGRFVESLRKIWNVTPQDSIEVDAEKAWREFSARVLHRQPDGSLKSTVRRTPASRHYAVRVAAVVVLLTALPYLLVKFAGGSSVVPPQQKMAMKEVSTEPGQRVKLKFSDGTTALLNSSTTIRFREKFMNRYREVYLEGEAYFDVVPLAAEAQSEMTTAYSPFIVRAGDAVVQVLGTVFNVKAWPDNGNVEVVVAKGKVAVHSIADAERAEVVVTDGEMSKVVQGNKPLVPLRVDLNSSLAWLDGRLVFHNTPLRDVARSLERRYDLQCNVMDHRLLALPLTASFKEESVAEVLKAIALSLDIDYQKSGRVVKFHSRKGRQRAS
ncbi:MAG: FecR family protein [Bacteroidota bacterium]